MTTLNTLYKWIEAPTETENLEFKEAKTTYDTPKLLKYCAALANEEGGYIVLGVSDKKPRKVIGSKAFSNPTELNRVKKEILHKLAIRVDTAEISHPDGRVLVFKIPPRATGQPVGLDGAYWMRSGESLVAMTPDVLKRIFKEGEPDWLLQPAKSDLPPADVVALLDTQSYFDLLELPLPYYP